MDFIPNKEDYYPNYIESYDKIQEVENTILAARAKLHKNTKKIPPVAKKRLLYECDKSFPSFLDLMFNKWCEANDIYKAGAIASFQYAVLTGAIRIYKNDTQALILKNRYEIGQINISPETAVLYTNRPTKELLYEMRNEFGVGLSKYDNDDLLNMFRENTAYGAQMGYENRDTKHRAKKARNKEHMQKARAVLESNLRRKRLAQLKKDREAGIITPKKPKASSK